MDEVETAALKQGRKVCSKLETKIKELEAELDQEQRRLTDTTKSLRKSERRIKELEFQVIYIKLVKPFNFYDQGARVPGNLDEVG